MASGGTELRTERGKPSLSIVGAGPAGLACAIALARAGIGVVVHQQRDRVGGRFHSDFQGLENWSREDDVLEELASSGFGSSFDHTPVSRVVAFDAWGSRYAIASSKPLYYLVRRGWQPGTLDRSLSAAVGAARLCLPASP
jgi:flavin-dependent dehydrogenase